MYNLQKIIDHADQGIAKFLEQFKDKANLEALARSYLNRIQELENAIWEVINIRGIEESEGVGLDAIGRIVGRPRLALVDADYRIALRAQIRINRSSGTPEDMLAVTGLSIPAGNDCEYGEAYPATEIISVLGQSTFNLLVLLDNLIRAKTGGVKLFLEYSPGPDGETFLWSDDDSEPDDTIHGGADDSPETIGGYVSDYLES